MKNPARILISFVLCLCAVTGSWAADQPSGAPTVAETISLINGILKGNAPRPSDAILSADGMAQLNYSNVTWEWNGSVFTHHRDQEQRSQDKPGGVQYYRNVTSRVDLLEIAEVTTEPVSGLLRITLRCSGDQGCVKESAYIDPKSTCWDGKPCSDAGTPYRRTRNALVSIVVRDPAEGEKLAEAFRHLIDMLRTQYPGRGGLF